MLEILTLPKNIDSSPYNIIFANYFSRTDKSSKLLLYGFSVNQPKKAENNSRMSDYF